MEEKKERIKKGKKRRSQRGIREEEKEGRGKRRKK